MVSKARSGGAREAAAGEIASRLMSMARRYAVAGEDGQVDVTDPATWRAVAQAMGLKVVEVHEPRGPRGDYVPAAWESSVPGLVRINTAYPGAEVAGVWVHELAHHLQVWWPQPPLLVEEGRIYRYGGDRRRTHHDVAARVERRVVKVGTTVSDYTGDSPPCLTHHKI